MRLQIQTLLTKIHCVGCGKRNPIYTRAPRRESSYGIFRTFGGNNRLRDCRLTPGTNANCIQIDEILILSVYRTLKRYLELNQVVLRVACSGKEILTLTLTTWANGGSHTFQPDSVGIPDNWPMKFWKLRRETFETRVLDGNCSWGLLNCTHFASNFFLQNTVNVII